ncbi:MAG: SDR family oxidoreductase [Xanthobacteraceae bacterium]|uniref:SDR family oxidoreductase n=1 Tax=Pseudolabrys sp. TaxID=1960880 RepID=UPI003D0A6E21
MSQSSEMKGKVVVITGGTSGLGRVTAEALAKRGARIVLVARDRERARQTLAALKAVAPDGGHTAHYADLCLMAETRRVAAEIAAAEPRIDVLMNNAGAIFASRQVTGEGLERTFALNHMSYFLMAAGLRDRLAATPGARIVNTASGAHRRGHVDFDDLQSARHYRGFTVYGTSKLCNILFTRALARRLAGTGVTANSFHPGFVATRFGDQSGWWSALTIRFGKTFMALSEEKGADTMIYLASSPEVAGVTGEYFFERKRKQPTAEAQDDAIAERLWQVSADIAGFDL